MPDPISAVPLAKSRLENLTILRFVAALWVISMHLQGSVPLSLNIGWHRLFSNGAYAMTVFFVLSGTVMAYGYHALRPKTEDVIAFYQARFARIYGPYILLHLVALIWVSPANAKEMSAAIYSTVLSALCIQAWFPQSLLSGANTGTWSISVEIFFYALFPALLPVVVFLRRRWGALRVCAYLSALTGFIGFADYVYSNSSLYYWMPATRLPEFMLGLVIGLELIAPSRKSMGNDLSLALAIACAAAAAINPVLEYGLWIRANLFVVPAFAWLIFELARAEQRRARSRSRIRRVLVYLGETSYCLFLTHMIPLMYLHSASGVAWTQLHWQGAHAELWLVVLVTALLGAILLHEAVEKPLRSFLLRQWQSPRQDTVTLI